MSPAPAGSFAVIFDAERRVLLCHRTDMDAWNLPGGAIEGDESPRQAVMREVTEETGLAIRVAEFIGLYATPSRWSVAFSFRCVPVGGTVCTNAEADRIEWFARAEIPMNTLPRHRERIDDAYENTGAIVLKSQV